jgi:hypothetical protein
MKLFKSKSALACALMIATVGFGGIRLVNAEPLSSAAAPMGQDNSTAANANGNWQMNWTNKNDEAKSGTLDIHQSGGKLSGNFTGERGTFPLQGTLEGNQISITVKAYGRKISFTGTLDGDKMSGTTEQGKPWTGTRQQ